MANQFGTRFEITAWCDLMVSDFPAPVACRCCQPTIWADTDGQRATIAGM
jgi:hypothetical protein